MKEVVKCHKYSILHPGWMSFKMYDLFLTKWRRETFFWLLNPTETVHDWWKPRRRTNVQTLWVCLRGTGQQMPVIGWAVTQQPGRWFEVSEWFGAKVQDLGRHLSPVNERKKHTALKGNAGLGCLYQPSCSLLRVWRWDFGLTWPPLERRHATTFGHTYNQLYNIWFWRPPRI